MCVCIMIYLLSTRMVLKFSLKCCVFDSVMFWKYGCLSWNIPVAAEKLEQAENQLAHSRFGPLIAPTPRKKEVSDCFFTSYSIFINLLEVLYQCIEVFFGLLKFFMTESLFYDEILSGWSTHRWTVNNINLNWISCLLLS